MKKQLLKPENWQDFESLCKMLWGVIWKIPFKIKKNGRAGQKQNGVDILGVPKGETGYSGVQCKGKDEFTHSKLSKKEIDEEIEKAKIFRPNLDVFVIATTANKDSHIEEHVRQRNLESLETGGFEILLYSWEDIADLICNNRNVYDYYVNNRQFQSNFDFSVEMHSTLDGKLQPTFHRKIIRYKKEISNRELMTNMASRPLFKEHRFSFQNRNLAMCPIKINMRNTGGTAIENWKIQFSINGRHKFVEDSLFGSNPMPNHNYYTRTREIVEESQFIYQSEAGSVLVQGDAEEFEQVVIPLPEDYSLVLNWSLIAKDFSKSGVCSIPINPTFEDTIRFERLNDSEAEEYEEVVECRENEYDLAEE